MRYSEQHALAECQCRAGDDVHDIAVPDSPCGSHSSHLQAICHLFPMAGKANSVQLVSSKLSSRPVRQADRHQRVGSRLESTNRAGYRVRSQGQGGINPS